MENSMKISHCESSEYLFKDTGEILGHWVRHSKVLSKHFQSIWMTGKVMIKVQVWVIPCILVSLMIWCQYQNRKKTSPFRNFLEVIDRYYFSNVSNVIPKFFMIQFKHEANRRHFLTKGMTNMFGDFLLHVGTTCILSRFDILFKKTLAAVESLFVLKFGLLEHKGVTAQKIISWKTI